MCYRSVNDLASVVREHHQRPKHFEAKGRDNEEINRHGFMHMILQKCLPILITRVFPSGAIFVDRSLRDVDSQFQ